MNYNMLTLDGSRHKGPSIASGVSITRAKMHTLPRKSVGPLVHKTRLHVTQTSCMHRHLLLARLCVAYTQRSLQ